MLNALKSVLRNQALRSAFKAIFFSFLLYHSTAGVFPAALFLAAASYFYFSAGSGRIFPAAFFALLFLSLFFAEKVSGFGAFWLAALSAVSGIFFFLLLGIKSLAFVRREQIFHFLSNFLFFSVFLAFFILISPSFYSRFFALNVSAFFAVYFLFKETLAAGGAKEEASHFAPSKLNLLAFGMAFAVSQLLWAVSLLPLGFLNASALAFAAFLAGKDLFLAYLSGALNRRVVLKNATFFIIAALFIFMASRWSL